MPDKRFIQPLLSDIQYFAQHATNPVLQVLDDDHVQLNQKYPAGDLLFSGVGWRGFYHCHDYTGRDSDEHGHFHLFTDMAEGDEKGPQWAHIVGLSMDREGQPKGWFTTNQWVTAGAWAAPDDLLSTLDGLQSTSSLLPVERWLLNLLRVYRNEIAQLLEERERMLTHVIAGKDESDKLANKDYYILSSTDVDLQSDLTPLVG